MKRYQIALSCLAAGLAAAIGLRISNAVRAADAKAKEPAAPAASTYAPVDDLLAQVDYYFQHIEETLANKADFDGGAKSRLKKDANTLAALFSVLGQHDTDNRFKPKEHLLGLVPMSLSLAMAPDYDTAVTNFNDLKQRASPENKHLDATEWSMGKSVSLEQLMKQVATINSALQRGVAPAKFDGQKVQSAGQSATLAAIGQAITTDTTAVKKSADREKWYKFAAEMRDSAGAVNAAVHADDQSATATAMSRMVKSCEACHAVFRKDGG